MIFLLLLVSSCLFSQDRLPEVNFSAQYRLIRAGVEVGKADITFNKNGKGYELKNNLAFKEKDVQVKFNNTAFYDESKSLVRYVQNKSLAGKNSRTQVDFTGNRAVLARGNGDVSLTIPGKRILMDNFSVADLVIFARDLSPEMGRQQGKLLVTSRMMLVDFEIESAGPARYTMKNEVIQCDLYKMTIAGSISAEFYLHENKLISFLQRPDYTAFELVEQKTK